MQEENEKTVLQVGNITMPNIDRENGIVLVPEEEEQPIKVIDPSQDMKFDERFKNRRNRRKFMSDVNRARVTRTRKVVVNPNTGKRKNIIVVKSNGEPRLMWAYMPKFTKAMSEQYSEASGIVRGWRNPGKNGVVTHDGRILSI